MLPETIGSPEQITIRWLTAVLSRAGALRDGAVAALTMDVDERELSTCARLTLEYTPDAIGERPERLFLKIVSTNLGDDYLLPSEVDYYTRDYVGVPGVPLLACYDAAYSPESESYHILLQDVSASHQPARGRRPTLTFGRALAAGLARMHAHWWGAARLSVVEAALPTASQIEAYVERARPGLPNALAECESEFDPDWTAALRDLFARHPATMAARFEAAKLDGGNGFTLVHGDPNWGNILVPKDGETPFYLIDRQPFVWSLTTWLGAADLAYLMGLYWEPAARRALEQPVLRYYHEELQRRGVADYDWDLLWDDYRHGLAQSIYVAVEWCGTAANCRKTKRYWLPMLVRAMAACLDLNCAALWRR